MIANLTNTRVTKFLARDGVVDIDNEVHKKIMDQYKWDNPPLNDAEIISRANYILSLFKSLPESFDGVLVGGPPFFTPILSELFYAEGITPYYSFTERITDTMTNAEYDMQKTFHIIIHKKLIPHPRLPKTEAKAGSAISMLTR